MYWISPSGKVTGISNGYRHIEHVISNPSYFNLKPEYLEEVYKKYDEKIPSEGKAREEIMIELMKKGWIRIRLNKTPYSWVLQTYQFSHSVKRNIAEWIFSMLLIGYTQEEEMRLMNISSSEERISFKDWLTV